MESLQDINPIERMLVDKATATRTPIQASFELTPLCNLHCDMCYVRTGKKEMEAAGGLLPLQEWLRFADQLKEMGTLFILLTGGEPLLYPDFKELYCRLKEKGFILTINTNATLIDDETARLFRVSKPRRVNVSLYGASNETYQSLCHAAHGFDRCMEGLKRLKENDIDTKLNLTLTRHNVREHRQMLDIADEWGMPALTNGYISVYARPECVTTMPLEAVRPEPHKVAQAEIEALKHKYGKEYAAYAANALRQLEQKESSVPNGIGLTCHAGKSALWINWRGTMTPCVDMEAPAVSLLSATVGEAWQQIVAECGQLASHGECAGCTLRPICDVCYANACNEKKRCGSIGYLCRIAQAKKQQMKESLQ